MSVNSNPGGKVKVKLSLCLINNRTMNTYGRVQVKFHAFVNSVLDGGQWSATHPSRFSPVKPGGTYSYSNHSKSIIKYLTCAYINKLYKGTGYDIYYKNSSCEKQKENFPLKFGAFSKCSARNERLKKYAYPSIDMSTPKQIIGCR
jgi:hypothetical protein